MQPGDPSVKDVVVLEHPALLPIPAVRRRLRTADTLVVFEPYGAAYEGTYSSGLLDRLLVRFAEELRPLTVLRVSHETHFDEMLKAGEEAVRFLDERTEQLKATAVCKGLRRLLGSDAVVLGLKKGLVVHLKDRIHFFKIAAALQATDGRRFVLVTAHPDVLGIEDGYGIVSGERWLIAEGDVRAAVRRRELIGQLKLVLLSLAGLLIRLNRRAFKAWTPLRWRNPRPQSVRWARPLSRGIAEQALSRPGETVSDDDLEDREDFRPTEWLYEQGHWPHDRTRLAAWRRYLDAKGARFVEAHRLRMSLGFYLRTKVPAGWARFRWGIRSLGHPWAARLLAVGYTMTEAHVDCHLFMQYYRPRVYEVADDYLIGHIVRTIVFNRYGCKTIGVQHGSYSSMGLNPYISYILCDTYCSYGPTYFERIWRDGWVSIPRLVTVGVQRNDYAHRALRNEERRAEFGRKYRGKRVLLWCPPAVGFELLNKRSLIVEVAGAIASFQRRHQDWIVIMHCRRPERAAYQDLLGELAGQGALVMEEDFTTYELIVYVDGIVTANLSTVGIEAICAGRGRVVFMNYWGRWKHPFASYVAELVAHDPKDLVDRLEGWAADHGPEDGTALDAFRRDFDVGFDGLAGERYKDEMRALAGLPRRYVAEREGWGVAVGPGVAP